MGIGSPCGGTPPNVGVPCPSSADSPHAAHRSRATEAARPRGPHGRARGASSVPRCAGVSRRSRGRAGRRRDPARRGLGRRHAAPGRLGAGGARQPGRACSPPYGGGRAPVARARWRTSGRPRASCRSRVAGGRRPPSGRPWWPDEHGPTGAVRGTDPRVPRASGHASACQSLREQGEAVDAPRDRGPVERSATARGPSGGPSSLPGPGPRAPTWETGSSDPCIGGSEGVAPPASASAPTGVHPINPLPSAFHMEMCARPRAGGYMRSTPALARSAETFARRAVAMTFVRGAEAPPAYPNSGSPWVWGNLIYKRTPPEASPAVPTAPAAASRRGATPVLHVEGPDPRRAGPGMLA